MMTRFSLEQRVKTVSANKWIQAALNGEFSSQYDVTYMKDEIVKREQLGSTRIAEKIVLPHILSNELKENHVIISQLERPIEWFDQKQVTVGIFLLVGEMNKEVDMLIRLLTDEQTYGQLLDPQLSLNKLQLMMGGQ